MRLIIGSLVIFSLIILFLFALFPADISVSRMLQIRAPAAAINKKIADLREWKTWNEMVMNPPRGTVADQSDHSSPDFLRMGAVTVKLIKALPDTLISQWQQGNKSFTGKYTLTESGGQTIVEWTLYFHIKWYPWEKLASMFYDKQLGGVMEKSLLNLQKLVEVK